MGSFCISCGVSGQVIADDDACLVVPIIQESTFRPVDMTFAEKPYSMYGIANSACYPDAFWKPMGGFVTGTYADYGRIAPNDTPTNRLLMVNFFRTLMQNAPVVFQGKNASHDVPFDLPAFVLKTAPRCAEQLKERHFDDALVPSFPFEELVAIWDYVWERTHVHRLFCRDNMGAIRPVQFSAFHSVTFDHLVKYASALKDWNGASYELGAYLKRHLDAVKAASADASNHKRFFLQSQIRDTLKLGLSSGVNGLLFPFIAQHHDLFEQYFDEGTPVEDLVAALRPSMEGVYALKAMDALNLQFSPIVYAGQDYDNSQGKAIAKFVSTVSKAITKERKQRYDE